MMKKVLLGVLALTLLAGCSFNLNEEPKENNYENFVPRGMTYYKTIEKSIDYNNKKYNFDFIFFYGQNDNDEYVMYQTILVNKKLISSGLNSFTIYKDYYENVDELKKGTDNLFKDLDNVKLDIIKDTANDKEYLLMDISAALYTDYKYIFIFDYENLIFDISDNMNSGVSFDGKHYDKLQIVNNKIYHLEDLCGNKPFISTYHIENGKMVKEKIYIPSDATFEGGC